MCVFVCLCAGAKKKPVFPRLPTTFNQGGGSYAPPATPDKGVVGTQGWSVDKGGGRVLFVAAHTSPHGGSMNGPPLESPGVNIRSQWGTASIWVPLFEFGQKAAEGGPGIERRLKVKKKKGRKRDF